MRTSATEQMQYAVAVAAATISNGDATVIELDRSVYGWPNVVSLVLIAGTVADTAVLDVFSVHGDDSGTITPAAGNLLKAHDAVAAGAGVNTGKVFKITVDLSARGDIRYLDAIVSNNVVANFAIAACFWEMSDPREIPVTSANFGVGSPKI